MHLSDDTLIHYLLARNVLPEEAAMSGTLRVIDRSSRNRNRRIQWEGAGVFVKQVRDPGPQFEETLRRDATCYWLVRDNPDFLALRDFVPRLRGFDSALHVLVIEDLEGFESLSTIGQRESSSLSVERAAELGEFLAVCHTRAGRSLMQDAANPWFAKRMPWVLTIPETPRHELAFPSRGAMALSDHVSTHRFFREMLGDLRRQWQVVAFIHGDMKWDNVLVRVSAASPSAVSIRITDWELARYFEII